jgi:hypothetical protein
MCHAYADEGWNDFLLLMTANNLEAQITVLDEAVTSELADGGAGTDRCASIRDPRESRGPAVGHSRILAELL